MCEIQHRCPFAAPAPPATSPYPYPPAPPHAHLQPFPHRRTLGKLLVIWGVVLPLIGLPYSLTGLYPALPVLNVALSIDGFALGTLVMSHHDMIAGSLALIGLGISLLTLPLPLE